MTGTYSTAVSISTTVTTGALPWTAWTDIFTYTVSTAGLIDIRANLDAHSTLGSGGGDRIFVQYCVIRTRSSVDSPCLWQIDDYLRNGGNFQRTGTGTNINDASQQVANNLAFAVMAAANDVYKVQARIIAQSQGAGLPNNVNRTVTWPTASNRLQILDY